MTYEKAKKFAFNLNPKFNSCREFEKGYHFHTKSEDIIDGDSGVVILKESGQAINWVDFILNYHPEKTPKTIVF